MTVPGVRVTSVRRTVLIAVALVTGQALLCGLIGFLTFGNDEPRSPTPAAEPQLAGPPLVVPPAALPPPDGLTASAGSTTARPPRTKRPSPAVAAVRSSATLAIVPTRTATVPPAPPPSPPAPSTTPTNRALLPSPQPSQGETPIPVAGEPCDVEGAGGRTADGAAVQCEPDRNGDLRWRLV